MTTNQIQCGTCQKMGPEATRLWAVDGGARRCVECAIVDARTGAMPDNCGLNMTGAFFKAVITNVSPARRMATDGAGRKICKVFDCGAQIDERFVLCKDHQAQAPHCACGRGKVGYDVRRRGWFDMCFQCSAPAFA